MRWSNMLSSTCMQVPGSPVVGFVHGALAIGSHSACEQKLDVEA